MATPQENKDIITRYVDATNSGELDLFDVMVVPDYVENDPIPGQKPGREGLKEAYRMFNGPFPDLAYIFEDVMGEDDLVVGRGIISGTQMGTFFGVPASGKKIHWTGTRLFRLKDGLVLEGWVNIDMMGMMQQIGIVPGAPTFDVNAERPIPPAVAPTAEDTPERNKEILKKIIEKVWHEGDLALAAELYHPEAVTPTYPALPKGPAGLTSQVSMFRGALSDFWTRMDFIVADGNHVAARMHHGGTHTGELMGVPATGKAISWSEMTILDIANGQVIQSWTDTDRMGLWQQLTAQA